MFYSCWVYTGMRIGRTIRDISICFLMAHYFNSDHEWGLLITHFAYRYRGVGCIFIAPIIVTINLKVLTLIGIINFCIESSAYLGHHLQLFFPFKTPYLICLCCDSDSVSNTAHCDNIKVTDSGFGSSFVRYPDYTSSIIIVQKRVFQAFCSVL